MSSAFLLLIYLAFVSLGLPDTLLGSAWTVMRPDLGVPLEAQGLITILVSCATIASCLLNGRLVRRLGTGKITALSGVITAAALLGYALSPSYLWLLLCSVPLGLGAGSVDTCLNDYAATQLTARHVNWLTCCYGLGASVGPLLLSLVLGRGGGWRRGYLLIALIQFAIAALLVCTLPAWRGRDYRGSPPPRDARRKDKKQPLLRIPGAAPALLSYAVFFAIQYGTALWAPSYLTAGRGFSPEAAARAISVFYICIMAGRFVSGILSEKYSDKTLLRAGVGLCIAGTLFLALPLPGPLYYLAAACIGLGCAPTFPSMLHLTPARFGRENSQRMMGVQMAAAYAGDVLISPLIGVAAARAGVNAIPWFLLGLCVLILCLSEAVDRITNW